VPTCPAWGLVLMVMLPSPVTVTVGALGPGSVGAAPGLSAPNRENTDNFLAATRFFSVGWNCKHEQF